MSTEWIVKHFCYPPLSNKAVLVVEHFDDEDCLAQFCHEPLVEVCEVLEIGHYPLKIEDRTDYYVPRPVPSKFERDENRGERIADERREGLRA